MKNRKSQEEIVGFVLIILLVTVILVILLGIYARSKTRDRTSESGEVAQFLDAMLEYTTECSLNSGFSYETISNLATNCALSNSLCSNSKSSCEVLQDSTKKLIESAWVFGEESPNKGYRFVIGTNGSDVIKQSSNSGKCDNLIGGTRTFQQVSFDLKICLN